MDHLPSILAIIVCVVMSAFFSAAETAYSSLNKTRLKVLADAGDQKAALALSLAEDYNRLLSTILIGNNIVNIAVASISTLLFVELYGDFGATVSTVVITAVILIFGEITPKSIAKDAPESLARNFAAMLKFLQWLLTPLTFIFSHWKLLVNRFFGSGDETKMSQEELLMLVEEVRQEGAIDKSEGELLKNAIEFRDVQAEDILTPRVDLEAVSIDDSKEVIGKKFTETHYSRLLVYDGSIDNIVGVINQKDFYVNGGVAAQTLTEIMTPPVFVHQYEHVRNLLKELQCKKSHIAVVVDEYGGTLGIVTMEDILEELVGEIWDEHDEVEADFEKLAVDTYRVDCKVTLTDFEDFFNLKLDSESVSVGGWIMEHLNHIPVKGEAFTVEHLEITVTDVDAHRVFFVTVKQSPKEEE
ncbi:HlyC/CorC family transporter [Phascolarctobacterium sp.]|uniref:HlyC/CorC family transporter n=1 Tax=Phascolarctobacterium sp. TaxID=2049039 RepID=UPI003869EDA4